MRTLDGSRTVCVFCGSAPGQFPEYKLEATNLGRLLSRHGITGIWGAGMDGLMGAFAKACIESGGNLIGVTTPFIQALETPVPETDQMVVISEKDMPDRKRTMIEGADAILILPGGIGTLDEAAEALTLDQLKMIVDKPIIFINVLGVFDHLFAYFERLNSDGFIRFPIRYQTFRSVDVAMEKLLGQLLLSGQYLDEEKIVRLHA